MICTVTFGVAFLLCFCSSNAQTAISGGSYSDVGKANIWYQECGSRAQGPAVVLLHDGLLHSITWNGIWASLCIKYHVVRYDRRGYGLSEVAKAPFVPEDDLCAIMHEVHMEHAIIMGNSSGAALALDFTLSHPEMVDGLFLIGPVVHGMATSQYFVDRGEQNNDPITRGDLKAAAENWSKDPFLISQTDHKARSLIYETLIQNPQNLTAAGKLEIRPTPPTVLRLPQIEIATAVLVGDADIADVFAFAGAIVAAVPVATLEVWKGTGHLIQIEQPTELVTRFNQFAIKVGRKEVPLSVQQLQTYIGEYRVGTRTGTVLLTNNHLALELRGDPYRWLFASSEKRFFLRTADPEIEFEKDIMGKVVEMIIYNSDGGVVRCPRIGQDTAH